MDSFEIFWYESFWLKNWPSTKAICLLASYLICSLQQESEGGNETNINDNKINNLPDSSRGKATVNRLKSASKEFQYAGPSPISVSDFKNVPSNFLPLKQK